MFVVTCYIPLVKMRDTELTRCLLAKDEGPDPQALPTSVRSKKTLLLLLLEAGRPLQLRKNYPLACSSTLCKNRVLSMYLASVHIVLLVEMRAAAVGSLEYSV